MQHVISTFLTSHIQYGEGNTIFPQKSQNTEKVKDANESVWKPKESL